MDLHSPQTLVLQINELPDDETAGLLRERFSVIELPATGRKEFLRKWGPQVRGLAGTGKGPVDEKLLDALPALEIISSYSAGLEGIDLAACAARNIPVLNTSHILAEDVADIAITLLVSAARQICRADRFVRRGEWRKGTFPLTRTLRGIKVGIVGLGHIGKATVQRLEALGCVPAYHGPREKPESSLPFHASMTSLARWADALVLCCPETPETRHLVNAAVLAELGEEGLIVNISRGSVIDEAALIAALANNTIAGAGLDVFEHEPDVPRALLEDERVTLLPHIGSGTRDTRRQMGRAMVEALERHLSSRAVT